MAILKIHDRKFKPYISKEAIDSRLSQIANEIEKDYTNKNPIFLAVLNGAFILAADLFRKITIQSEISFVKVSSYEGVQSAGNVKQLIGFAENLKNRDVIIVEDIIDTGITMSHILSQLNYYQPKSVKLLTLLFKPKALKTPINPDYVCFEIEPEFVLGYGLDYDGLGRNLPDIYVEMKE